MRSFIKNLALPLGLILAAIVLNIIVLYSSALSADTVQSRSVYGVSSSEDMAVLRIKQRLIGDISGDYSADISALEERIKELRDYQTAVRYIDTKDSSLLYVWAESSAEERAERAQRLYTDALSRFTRDKDALPDVLERELSAAEETADYLRYLLGYGDYVSGITERSDFLSDISIYKQDSEILGNILNTRKDFYGLENITLTPVCETGFMLFLNYGLADIFAAIVPIISLAALKNSRRKGVLFPVALTLFGAGAMYLTNLALIGNYLGLPPVEAAVQSMQSFQSCPYMINAGLLAALVILMKMAGCLVILFIASAAAFSSGKKRIITAAVALSLLAAEAFCALSPTAPTILSEINILSFFSFERFYIRYLNLDVFGLSVARLPVFLAFAAAVIAALRAYSALVIKAQSEAAIREAEQEYFDEINRRYNESRKIRHDINNHLLAVSALIESGSIEEAKRYITEVSEQSDLAAMPIKTGRNVLDALLFKKTEQAAEKGCKITFEIDCPISGASDYDLCTIFGNVLDNAIEAAGTGDRIFVKIGKQLDMLYISCENPFSGELKRRGDRILTTKKDVASHGFGIMRVRELAGRYGGDVSITAENGVFLIEILLNTSEGNLEKPV
ncbi:MAG: sensor histidine kinase [Oscillospiraceae bacterium]